MYRPILLPLAKQDIAQAAHWYNSKQKGLGKRFVAELRACVKYICQNPKLLGFAMTISDVLFWKSFRL